MPVHLCAEDKSNVQSSFTNNRETPTSVSRAGGCSNRVGVGSGKNVGSMGQVGSTEQ